MNRPARILLVAASLGIVASGVAWVFRGPIAFALVPRMVANAMADTIAELPDGLHVGLCGAGSPFTDATHSGPCVAVVAGRRLFVVDVGEGSSGKLLRMRLPPARVEAVFLTHFHSDHIDGLGSLMLQRWGGGAHDAPLPIHGPQGVESVVAGFNAAYTIDRGYRIAHHGPKTMPPSGFGGIAIPFASPPPGKLLVPNPGGPDVTVLDEDGLVVTAFPVNHAPVEPAVGYVFAYKGRKIVLSGDTAPTPRMEQEAKGADVLVHEALSPKLIALIGEGAHTSGHDNLAAVMKDIVTYHTTPEQAAGIAQRAGVGFLLLNHLVPTPQTFWLEEPFLGDARAMFSGPLKVGRDGDFVSLPAGSKDINVSNIMY